MMNVKDPLVSIIIPTYNSEKTLTLCLNALSNQTYEPTEVIIVDKHSNDRTQEIAIRFQVKVIECVGLIDEARNAGLLIAQGKYCVSLDSDIELTSTVIEECVELGETGSDVITFPEEIIGEGYWARCRALEAQCYIGDDTIEAPRFFRTDVLRAIGGYQTSDAEDWDLRERLLAAGFQIFHIKSMTYHHEGKVRLFQRVRKKFIYTGNMQQYIRRHKKTSLLQFPLFRSAYYRNWKLLIRNPLHTLGIVLMKILETMAVIFGLVYHQLFKQRNRIFD